MPKINEAVETDKFKKQIRERLTELNTAVSTLDRAFKSLKKSMQSNEDEFEAVMQDLNLAVVQDLGALRDLNDEIQSVFEAPRAAKARQRSMQVKRILTQIEDLVDDFEEAEKAGKVFNKFLSELADLLIDSKSRFDKIESKMEEMLD